MRRHRFEKYTLTAMAVRSGSDFWMMGTFGPFSFAAITRKCEECHNFITGRTSVQSIKGSKNQQACDNALFAIEERLSNAQAPKLQQGESIEVIL